MLRDFSDAAKHLVWMGLELLLYGEIQPRIVDDIMWFLFLPFVYIAVNQDLGE